MYFRVSIPLSGRSQEEICERLADFDVAGIEELADSVAVFVDSQVEAETIAAAFGGGAPEEMEDRNWSEDLQAVWTPLCVGERFYLCPAWIEPQIPEGRILVEMVPGNVFGGGDHSTTQLCLELLERLAAPDLWIADIGAGTGILTRGARALGARAVGCDIDRASSGLVDFVGSADALAGGRFDGVIANIHVGVLRELQGELQRLARPGGWLLVSGFLPEQVGEVEELFGSFLELRELGGWCAGLVGL